VMLAIGGAALVSDRTNTPARYTPPSPAVALKQLLALDGQRAVSCSVAGDTVRCDLANGGYCTRRIDGNGRCDIDGRVALIVGSDSRNFVTSP